LTAFSRSLLIRLCSFWTFLKLPPSEELTLVQNVTSWVVKLQSGYLYHYAFVMLIGVLVLALWLIAGAGA